MSKLRHIKEYEDLLGDLRDLGLKGPRVIINIDYSTIGGLSPKNLQVSFPELNNHRGAITPGMVWDAIDNDKTEYHSGNYKIERMNIYKDMTEDRMDKILRKMRWKNGLQYEPEFQEFLEAFHKEDKNGGSSLGIWAERTSVIIDDKVIASKKK